MSEIDSVTADHADEDALFGDVAELIESARRRAAAAVNSELAMLYWHVGVRVRRDVLGGERAEYGRQVIRRLADRLTARYGRGFGQRSIERMVQFAECYPQFDIASPPATQLTWTHMVEVLTLEDSVKRDFYLATSRQVVYEALCSIRTGSQPAMSAGTTS